MPDPRDPRAQDLLALDRDVARGCRALADWHTTLARDPEACADDQPLEPVRHVAGQSTWRALRETSPSAADVPLRDALVSWIAWLTTARIVGEEDLESARAAHEPRGRFNGEPPRSVNWRESWRGAVGARSTSEVRLWIEAACEAAPRLAGVARRRAAKRVEVARRLGASHPWQLLGMPDAGPMRGAARRLLDATEDLARATRKEIATDAHGVASFVLAAMGREANDGWPARLAPRWLEEVFGGRLGGLRLELAELPPAHGSASFARALRDFGFAVRLAATASSMPFALAREPGSRAAHRLAFVFAALAANAEWQTRSLGVGMRTAQRQARIVARTALFDARLHAARLLLGDEAAPAPVDLFDEVGERLFGGPLDGRLRGAWPAARDDEPARLVALLEARSVFDGLRNRFDADWFRNPRAWQDLLQAGAGPAREAIDADALTSHADGLGRAFEEALG
jgi:hypothetical protein